MSINFLVDFIPTSGFYIRESLSSRAIWSGTVEIGTCSSLWPSAEDSDHTFYYELIWSPSDLICCQLRVMPFLKSSCRSKVVAAIPQ